MAFLLEGIAEAGAIYETLKNTGTVFSNLKDTLYIGDNLINKTLDIGQQIYLAMTGEQKNTDEIEKINFDPDFKNQYSTFNRIATRLIPTYGMFCGPNYTGGARDDDIKEDNFNVKPVDELDNLCKNHDFQYSLKNVPRNQTLADKELISQAERLLYDNKYSNSDYLKALISLFKKKLFLDVAENGKLPDIKLPNVDDYFQKKGIYSDNVVGNTEVKFSSTENTLTIQ